MKKLVFFIICLISVNSFAEHYIGEYYQGGKVFYVDKSGEHGLIAALYDSTVSPVQWTSWRFPVEGTKDGIGGGKWNTNLMLDTFKGKPSIADFAVTCSDGGYLDWYIPSSYELNILYESREIVDNFIKFSYMSGTGAILNPNTTYWSSTGNFGSKMLFDSITPSYGCGKQCIAYQYASFPDHGRVRLIRQF